MLTFDRGFWEILGRTSAVYLILAVTLRLAPKRNTGGISPNDLIALVLIGALTSDAISAGAESSADLLLMVGLVLLWDYLLNLLEYHFPRFRKVAQDSPTLLIYNGRILERNLRRELMTEEELAANLRKKGITDIQKLKPAVLEVDGQISTIEAED
jgi:uncharacterized membrane protein YcaP (DUF421 family)